MSNPLKFGPPYSRSMKVIESKQNQTDTTQYIILAHHPPLAAWQSKRDEGERERDGGTTVVVGMYKIRI